MRQISLSSSTVFSLALWHRCANVTDLTSRESPSLRSVTNPSQSSNLVLAKSRSNGNTYIREGCKLAENSRKICTKLNIHAPHDAEIPLLRAQRSTREKQECVCSKICACVWSAILFIWAQTENISNIYQLKTDQPVVVYPFNGITLTMRKKLGVHPATCYTFKSVYKGKVSQAKDCRLYAPVYMNILKSWIIGTGKGWVVPHNLLDWTLNDCKFQGRAGCALETVELSPPGTLEVGGSLGKFQVSCILLRGQGREARLVAPLLSLSAQSFCLGEHRFAFSLQLYLLWLLINCCACM